ncbi:M15 family metallopeptidase [Gephyromycinifex aptenodytis]|uniref:M15 family metallopeptidase n=1 Tax=Gephyromycinifex aptenodytis TaxID=2716227 RepID=UPI001444FFAA|nr:M15 family metallopeptidase [Gephyromycinifex aptenodytis]
MKQLLSAPDPALLEVIPQCRPLPIPAGEDALDAVVAGENNDPLITIPSGIPTRHVYEEMNFATNPPQMALRASVTEKILAARASLPPEFDLVVLDGWRTLQFQGELLQHYEKMRGGSLDGYVSAPDSPNRIPPHPTGGAVDLTLTYRGVPLAMGSDFDVFEEEAHVRAFEDLPADAPPEQQVVAALRRLLAQVLTDQGFAPYPWEWWHWSYGEQRWAAQYGHARTLFDVIAA